MSDQVPKLGYEQACEWCGCVLCRAVEGGLKYKHFSSWNYVLDVLSTFYEVLGGSSVCHKFMTKVCEILT